MLNARKNVAVYESLDDYVGEVSIKASLNVKLENVQMMFLYFACSLVLVSFVFVMHIFLFKQLQTINRKLIRGSAILAQQMSLGDLLFPRIAIHLNPKP